MSRIPSLKSIQAFEAVARNMSFKAAADELCVTPTAISHQVKSLEEFLGVQLFHRLTRSLRLTAEGAVYAPLVIEAFEKLTEASEAIMGDDLEGVLTITTTGSFASNWLSPRLKGFTDRFPQIAVRIQSSDEVIDFKKDEIDVAIRYGHGEYDDLHAAWVLDDYVSPVCAPDHLSATPDLDELRNAQLIQYEWAGFSDDDPSWQRWFEHHGGCGAVSNPFVTYSEEHMCISAATNGHGVALVSLIAAAQDLEDERLVAPFDDRMKNKTYYLVCPKATANRAKIKAFQDWLLEEADKFRDSPVGLRFFEIETQ
ncbi:transcriptional regulator GcvA [Roseibium sp. SCP14]|uniref:transcriptional regulator GcvA n=1 Tax=Roseibium sp. SCP14 TaxID=3141375 RepID=UPI003339C6DC